MNRQDAKVRKREERQNRKQISQIPCPWRLGGSTSFLISRQGRFVSGFLLESQAIQHVLDPLKHHAQLAVDGEELPAFLDALAHFLDAETVDAGGDAVLLARGQDVLHRL